jgi:hypothetical protein
MTETNLILLSATAIVTQLLLLGWHFRRRQDRQLLAVKVITLDGASGHQEHSRPLHVFLPTEQGARLNGRDQLLYVNTGDDWEQWRRVNYND